MLAALLGRGLVAGVFLLLAWALLLTQRSPYPAWAQLPTAVIITIFTSVAFTQAVATLSWRPLSEVHSSRTLLALLGLTALLAARKVRAAPKRKQGSGGAPAGWQAAISQLPALIMLGAAVISFRAPVSERAAWFVGGDHVRHLIFTAEIASEGYLSYEANTYPRAWHALLAQMWTVDNSDLTADSFFALTHVMSGSVWMLYALLVHSVSWATWISCRRAGANGTAAAVAGCVAGGLLLLPNVAAPSFVFGFETSMLATLLMSALTVEVLTHARTLRSLWVCAMGVCVMAHTWQLLLPPAVLLAGFALYEIVKHRSLTRRETISIASAIASAALVAGPGLWAAVAEIGLGHATEEGLVTFPGWTAIVLGSGAVLAILILARCDAQTIAAGFAVLVIGFTAISLSVVLRVPITMYYPTKLLWVLVITSVPFALRCFIQVHLSLSQRFRTTLATCALATTSVALAAVVSTLSAVAALNARWSMVSEPASVVRAVATGATVDAPVVWLGAEPTDGVIARILLDFYRVDRTHARTSQGVLSVSAECALLANAVVPTVISDVDPALVAARYACMPDLRVVPLGGAAESAGL